MVDRDLGFQAREERKRKAGWAPSTVKNIMIGKINPHRWRKKGGNEGNQCGSRKCNEETV